MTYSNHVDHSWNARSRIVLSPKVVEPLYESWSDWQIICEVGKKLGYAEYFPWETREEAIDYELEPLGITCRKLRAHPEGIPITLPPLMYKKMMKFKHYPEIAKEYPLILMTGSKLETYTHSMMRNIPELYEQFPKNLLKINPERAAKLEIEDGDVVSVESSRGRIECSAYVTDRIDPRVVSSYHGFAASNANVLTDNLHLLQNSGCEEINNFIQDLLFVDEDKGETVISLRKLVLEIAPSAKEEIKNLKYITERILRFLKSDDFRYAKFK